MARPSARRAATVRAREGRNDARTRHAREDNVRSRLAGCKRDGSARSITPLSISAAMVCEARTPSFNVIATVIRPLCPPHATMARGCACSPPPLFPASLNLQSLSGAMQQHSVDCVKRGSSMELQGGAMARGDRNSEMYESVTRGILKTSPTRKSPAMSGLIRCELTTNPTLRSGSGRVTGASPIRAARPISSPATALWANSQ